MMDSAPTRNDHMGPVLLFDEAYRQTIATVPQGEAVDLLHGLAKRCQRDSRSAHLEHMACDEGRYTTPIHSPSAKDTMKLIEETLREGLFRPRMAKLSVRAQSS